MYFENCKNFGETQMKKVFGLLVLLLTVPLVFAAGGFQEGKHYQLLATPQPTASDDKIEVLELFWYGCPHCYQLEPELKDWLKQKPDDVAFVRIPAVLGPTWELHARAYYTAELLGVEDKIHTPLFERLHKQRKPVRNAAELREFFKAQGVSEADFDKTFKSFAVITKTNRAKQAREMYGLTGVPTLVINGKYRTTAKLAGGNKQMLQVTDFLVTKEREASAGSAQSTAQ
jgi:thiol:disulfide interchange protein DsbA